MTAQLFWAFLKITLAFLGAIALILWAMWGTLKRSDDPTGLLVKWIVTGVLLAIMFGAALSIGWSPILPVMGAAFGIVFAVLWGRDLGELMARPFTSLMDGGATEPDPVPLYSIAETRRKQGKPAESLALVREQLEKFPHDFRGWMMAADLQAEDLHDLDSAAATVEHLLALPELPPRNIAFALNRLADWELKFRHDPAGARSALERIVAALPETEQAQLAMQRLARLADPASQAVPHETPKLVVKHAERRLGLLAESAAPVPSEKNLDAANRAAAELVQRLQAFPADDDAREQLAKVYAEDLGRPDLAESELEQLITSPNQPTRQVVHWLNLLADFQIKYAQNAERARATLHRISELFPKTAHAEKALGRIARVSLELRGQQKSQVVKLGSYEKNLGLK